MRRAPTGGYDFSRKRDYRRKVWATFRTWLKNVGVPLAEAQALLMPSLEGDEIEVALNAGFREQNLHVVDQSAAVVATLKRRYRRINTYGVAASEALKRISNSGVRLHAANLDFCGQLSRTFLRELAICSIAGSHKCKWNADSTYQRLFPHGAFSPECFVAVTMLRGRESREVTGRWAESPITDDALGDEHETMLDIGGQSEDIDRLFSVFRDLNQNDRKRIHAVKLTFEFGGMRCEERWRPEALPLRAEHYKSTNGQTMLWSIWRILSGPKILAGLISKCDDLLLDKIRPVVRSGLLNHGGLFDGDSVRIWSETLPILKQSAAAKGLRLSDEEIVRRAEEVLGHCDIAA